MLRVPNLFLISILSPSVRKTIKFRDEITVNGEYVVPALTRNTVHFITTITYGGSLLLISILPLSKTNIDLMHLGACMCSIQAE